MTSNEFNAYNAFIQDNIASVERALGPLSSSDSNKVFMMCARMWKHLRASKGFGVDNSVFGGEV